MLVRVIATVAALAGLTAPTLASAEALNGTRPSGLTTDVQADGCLTTIDRQSAYKAGSIGSAIEIGKSALTESKADPEVNVTGSTGAGPITAYKVEVELSFKRWTVLESKPGEITENASSWSNSLHVNSFAKYGIGVFKFHVTTESAGKICFVTAYVTATQTSPFLTIAGAAASVAGLLALYLFASYFGGIGFPQEISYSVKKKRRFFKPRLRPGPMLGGILGAVAALVILQQAALVYPDTRLTAATPLAGLVFSFLFTSTIRKRETSRDRRRREDDDDDDLEFEDDYAPKKEKTKRRTSQAKTSGRHPSGKSKPTGKNSKRPTAQRPRPAAFIPTPAPPPPPQPNSQPATAWQPAGGSPSTPESTPSPASFPRPGSMPSGPVTSEPTPLPPPPPPFLG